MTAKSTIVEVLFKTINAIVVSILLTNCVKHFRLINVLCSKIPKQSQLPFLYKQVYYLGTYTKTSDMFVPPKSKGFIIILSSPSGGGKSSLARSLLKLDNDLRLSISATTRKPRHSERDGVDYYFKAEEEFKQLLEQGEFLEYAKVYNNYYGTPKKPIEDMLTQGKDVLFDIDLQGANSIKRVYTNAVTIFIVPPSLQHLEKRIRSRDEDNESTIKLRLAAAKEEIAHMQEYDYIVVNDVFDTTLSTLQSIITAERARSNRLSWGIVTDD